MQYRGLSRHSGIGKVCVLGGVILGAFGCDGSGASNPGDGGATDGGAREAGSLLPTDAPKGGNPDGRIPRDPPVISELLKKLPLTGRVTLLGTPGFSGCTNQDPSPGDRWCALARTAELGRAELWVINVTKIADGTPVVCTGADPNCLRLTQNLWTAAPSVGPRHPTAHAFDGDTLIFHADATSASTELYRGPIYAWRPTWPQARRISSPNGVLCSGHFRGEVAVCLDNIELDETKPLEFDLLAGPLPAAPNQQLPRMDRIHALRTNDVSKWRSSFSRDASQFCYSTGRTGTDPENLWCFKTSDMAANAVATGVRTTQRLVADASRWLFSRDAQKLYFLRAFNYSTEGNSRGSLFMVDYPSGGNPVQFSDNTGAFFLLSDGTETDKGVAMYANIQQNRGDLRFVRDRAAPTSSVLIASRIASASVSSDLRYTFFSRDVNEQTDLADAFVARNNEATAEVPAPLCALQTDRSTALFGSPFLKSAGLVLWMDEVDPNTLIGKGMVANPADCSGKRQFATDLDYWFVANDDGVVFSDETDIDIVSLRYARVTGGNVWPATGPVKVQGQMRRVYSLLLPKYDVAVIEIDQGNDTDGVYYVKLPLQEPVTPDGGADTGSAPDAGADAM